VGGAETEVATEAEAKAMGEREASVADTKAKANAT